MGEHAGFAVGWSDFLANVAPAAYAGMAAVEFLERLVAAIGPIAQVVASTAILAFAAMQWFGIRLSARVQQAASAIAAIALIGLVLGCFIIHTRVGTPPLPPTPTVSFLGALVLAIQSIVVTYHGWYAPIYFAEETRHPTRQLPRAMFGGVALVAVIYLLLNAAFLRALGRAGLAACKFAAADAARLIFGRASEIVISLIGVVILLTLLNNRADDHDACPIRRQPRWPLLASRRPGCRERHAPSGPGLVNARRDRHGAERHRRSFDRDSGILIRRQLLFGV